jgi:hypothetical protein
MAKLPFLDLPSKLTTLSFCFTINIYDGLDQKAGYFRVLDFHALSDDEPLSGKRIKR